MGDTVGDLLLRRLAQWGVRRIYGEPGEGLQGLIGAFGRSASGVEFVPARHEELAAFMACAHARFSGEVGVCMASSLAGAIHLLNGLYDARLDRQPVLAIVGTARAAGGSEAQDVDLRALLADVAPAFTQVIATPPQLRPLLDGAMRAAREARGVSCLILPREVQAMPAADEPAADDVSPEDIRPSGAAIPDAAELRRAAGVLNAGERVALLVGAGALHATDELIEAAQRLGAGIAKSLQGKAAVPDDLPFVTGTVGLLGSKPSWDLLERCDALLCVGTGASYAEFLAGEGLARRVQIDSEPFAPDANATPGEVRLVGDAKATLAALLPLLDRKTDRRFREQVERDVARWWQVLDARALAEAEPINPERVFSELSPRLPEHCIVTCDAGACAHWFARDVRLRRGMSAALPGGLARAGTALPYAIAAKYAQPQRPVIALLGDAAMQMNGINALISIAQRWREWVNPRLTVMVLNSGEPVEASWAQRLLDSELLADAAPAAAEFPYAGYAELIGLRGLRVDHAEAVGPAWAAALGADVPTVLEMVTDPRISPLPPQVAPQQARAYLAALQGNPAALGVVRATAREWWDGLVAGRH
jgi:pyruvate dehydrogenase (quinone)